MSCSIPGWSCEEKYNMSLFFLHFWGAFSVDLLVIFLVGRMHTRRGVDQLSLILPCLLGSIYPSAVDELRFARVSLSLFEMYCRWSIATWLFASVELLLVAAALFAHFIHARRTGRLSTLLSDAILGFLLFLFPQIADPAFHLHHWFVAWLVAMLARFEPYWSRGTQMFFVGYYINGIAVYGRDPLLACANVAFLNTKMGCGIGEMNNATNNSHPHVYVPPNLWNCTGDYAR
ncbi:hypothetical protein GUITHDRAFT_76391 [Guillardia theta CCMP2712]|uniref:Uncharacterized protein n=1 Tax=Guillardia theta (strain CCMP2712) TaxID=905079 RepID=L1ITC4_GUITC|nr:hypothetical protein GUITHDRAFT_76391 [Guillardia theta CCMP2712]EKX39483.1 hypothetical protein GUITHDRAFT_76391 [Guillardia theta CCMP2712]|eukprot:XP_005826463.1 hypothetical protein GUITHDRAFT_76391 [Guillardia theta CCMP2712]